MFIPHVQTRHSIGRQSLTLAQHRFNICVCLFIDYAVIFYEEMCITASSGSISGDDWMNDKQKMRSCNVMNLLTTSCDGHKKKHVPGNNHPMSVTR